MFKKTIPLKSFAFGVALSVLALVLAYVALTSAVQEPGNDPARVAADKASDTPTSAPVDVPASTQTAEQPPQQKPAPARPHISDPVRPSGSYLAGQHAESLGEARTALDFYGTAAQDAELATVDLYSRMYVLGLTEGDLTRALTALDLAESMGGSAPLAKLTRAVHAFASDDFDTAEALLSDQKIGIVRLLGAPLIAWARVAKNDLPGALAALETMRDDPKIEPMRLLQTGLILDVSGDAKKAGEMFLGLKNLTGLSVRSVQLMGANLERQGLSEQALALYQEFSAGPEGQIMLAQATKRINAGTPPPRVVDSAKKGAADAIYGVSTLVLAQGSGDIAMALSNMALNLRPDFPAATLVRAGALEQGGRLDEANAIYAKIPVDNPLVWTTRLRMAGNLDRLDRTDEAVALLRTMAKNHPGRTRPLIDLGEILRRHNRFTDSIEAYNQVLDIIPEIRPEHWVIFYSRGISFEQTDQWPKAEADFLKALELEPEQPLVLNYLGYSWIDQGQNLDRALDMIRKAVELRPRDGYIVDSLGWGLYRIGDFKGAVKSLERATMLLPADPLVNDHLGDALWRVGRVREARFQWQRALDLGPDADIKASIFDKLKSGLVPAASQ